MNDRPSLLFYCQHSVGLGHLMRSYALCAALTERFRVVLLCGGTVPRGIQAPEGVTVIALPPLGVGPDGGFVSHDARYALEEAWDARRTRILAALRAVRPSVVLVELFPFGRAKFARELVPLLEEAHAAGAFTACSVRDLLVSRRENQQAHDDRARELADAHFDAVLVHSDPAFARLEETFVPSVPLSVPVHYTGFAVREARPPRAPEPHVVVSAGGGLVGEPLLTCAAAAQRATGANMRLIAGPLLPDAAWERLRGRVTGQPGLELVRCVPDLAAELARASASVSQAGYNTVLEVIRSGVPALVVPYATPEEDEQLSRARRLERLGALRVLDPQRLDPSTLAQEIERLHDFTPRPATVDLGGAARTCELLDELTEPAGRAEVPA